LLEKSIDGNIRKRDDTSTKIISAIWEESDWKECYEKK